MKKLLLLAALLLTTACDQKGRGMETRTFELNRLSNDEAIELVTPYIREGGFVGGKNRLISVREHEDRLDLIENLLKKYDGIGEAVDVVLDIRIVQANGFTTRDSALVDVEQTLRETFRYRGYKLVGETRVQTQEGTTFSQSVGSVFHLQGAVQRVRAVGQEQRVPIQIELMGAITRSGGLVTPSSEMKSTVTGVMGKPVVLGQSTGTGATILIITPSVAR